MFELTPKRYHVMRNQNPYRMQSMMSDFFNNDQPSTYGIRTDVKETDNEYILEAELPGFNKEDITIETKSDVLTITANKVEENEDKKNGYLRIERRSGQFERNFNVEGINSEKISAKYNNGILEVILPKLEKVVEENKKIPIN